jgi:hypothetical protein
MAKHSLKYLKCKEYATGKNTEDRQKMSKRGGKEKLPVSAGGA